MKDCVSSSRSLCVACMLSRRVSASIALMLISWLDSYSTKGDECSCGLFRLVLMRLPCSPSSITESSIFSWIRDN